MLTSCGDISKDIFIEIVSKLPVKSLLRFRSCCKLVHYLVKDPYFISIHVKNYNDDNTRLIVSYLKEEDNDEVHIPLLYPDETLSDFSHHRLYPLVLRFESIIGCQDGLIFLFNALEVKILNLATRKSIKLSICRSKLPANFYTFNFHVGFGLDPISKEGRLVVISTLYDDETDTGSSAFSHVATYSLNTNTWREYGDNSLINYQVSSKHTHLNGFCYWIMQKKDGIKVICSFDLSAEVFNEIEWPYNIPKSKDITIGLHSVCLSLTISELYQNSFDIWVMNKGLWTKQSTIDIGLKVYYPIGFFKNGMCFVQQECWGLLFFDPSTKEVRNLGLDDYFLDIDTFGYKESLIALHGDD